MDSKVIRIVRKKVMDKIYIAGCGGMLGEAFYEVFKNDFNLLCTDIDVNCDWLTYLDFRNLEQYRESVKNFNPDCLIHLGAFTDLEYCELNIDETYRTNTTSVENAVYIANELEIPLVYISTAGIFDGKKSSYDDWDSPNPLCVYARSKYMGERFVVENIKYHLVCRAGWMMGAGPTKDKKFIQKLMKQLKDGNRELAIVNDKNGTPTYTHDFAQNVKLLLDKNVWGLYNMVCEGETSRLEVAEELIKILQLENKVIIKEVNSDYFSKDYFVHRPPSERLINRKLNIRNLNVMRNWKIALKEYIDNYYVNYLSEN